MLDVTGVCSTDRHDAIKLDEAAWSRLVFIGTQRLDADESGPAEAFEVRNCSCGSTLYKPVPVVPAAETAA